MNSYVNLKVRTIYSYNKYEYDQQNHILYNHFNKKSF